MFSVRRSVPYPRPWPRRLQGYLALARISNSPTVASDVLAGAALAGIVRLDGAVAFLAVAMVLFYTAGMFLNDLFDHESDTRKQPYRPLPSGLVSRAEAVVGVLLLFGTGLLILAALGSAPFVAGLVLVALIALYDRWHKANPFSPLLMASTRFMVYIVAFLAFEPVPSAPLLLSAGALGLYIVGLTYVAKKEGIPSFGGYWPAVLLFLPAVLFLARVPPVWSLFLLPAFVAWVAYSASFIYSRANRSIGRAVGQLIAGVALVDSLVLGTSGSGVGVALALLAFAATLFFQRYVRGT